MTPKNPKKTVGRKVKMKLLWSLVVAGVLLLLPGARAQFTWPVYESFGEYTNGTILGVTNLTVTPPLVNAASPWWGIIGNGIGSSQPIVQDFEALAYPALLADNNATPKGVSSANVTGSHDAAASFSGQTNRTIYASFLLSNLNNQGTTIDRMFFSLNTGTSASGGFGMSVYLTSDYRLKIRKNPSGSPSGVFTDPTAPLSTNGTHLVVIRYQTNSIANAPAEVDLWLDPTPFGNNAQIPPPTLSTTNGANVSTFKLLVIPSRGTGLYTYYMDEIRLGDTWASVTPLATIAPGPMFTVSGGGIGCPGDIFPVNLSGSVATNDYWLYTNSVNTGIKLTGNGSALNFGSFSTAAYYSVLASNNVNGNLGWMSNSVTIYVRAAVSITSQPVPITTATNSRAEFDVGATGDQISYQWYKTGNPSPLTNNSTLTGAQTNSLVIWPATAADIGSYYCVITNACTGVSGVASSSANLTLDAPNNLVWIGDVFSVDVWDVYASLAEWSGGSGFFNQGDNVTFDDTYTYPQPVTLNGVLTPTSINVNAARDYLWGGAGTLAGANSLVKGGAGRLIVSNNAANSYLNTYSGGTVINGGLVYVQSASALGGGPITLAGGGLETLGKLTFTNNVFVTASSVCQLDQSGQQSITFSGPVVGSPGTTLVFTNSNTLINSPNWVVLTGSFTNNSAIVLSVLNTATNSKQTLVLNVATNSEILNGAVSDIVFAGTGYTAGGGGLIKNGAGAAYLNAANTYSIATTNLSGLLAGTGSVSSPVFVDTNGVLGGGSPTAIGTFTINNNLILNGNAFVRVNKALSPAQSNDLISVTGTITNTGVGTVTVTNIGVPALAVGDSFKIFSGAVSNGAALKVAGSGVTWTNKLAVDGSVQVYFITATYPTNISYTAGSGTVTLSWPATHLGWILQNQTNSLAVGLTTATNTWYDIPNTGNVLTTNITVVQTNPAVFYRLRHP